jgi:hypothetical protein
MRFIPFSNPPQSYWNWAAVQVPAFAGHSSSWKHLAAKLRAKPAALKLITDKESGFWRATTASWPEL